jgi:hypothetical protein
MPEMLKVNPDLVSAPGVKSAQYPATIARDLYHFVSRPRWTARFQNSHFLTLNRMAPDRAGQFPGTMAENPATEGEVVFSDFAPGKGTAEPVVGGVILGHNQATASLPVKTMHYPRSELTADPAQIATMKEQRMYESASCCTCAWVDGYPRWFVDDQKSFVLEQNIQCQILGLQFDRNRWGNFYCYLIPSLDQLTRTNDLPV